MAGHSQFKNIMFRKGAQDKKRSALFSKLSREITVAAKEGLPDPAANARLRAAITAARAQSMPRDNIERAIKKSQGSDGENYEAVRYEGRGPGGISLIIDSLTDNRNRTASDVRTALQKGGGSMGETGSVSYMFDHVGEIKYPLKAGSADKVFEAALEAGASDVVSEEDGHEIYCEAGSLHAVREALEPVLGEAESAKLVWKPHDYIEVDEDNARTLLKLLDVLDDNDDVQNVYGNYDVPEEIMQKLNA